MIKVLVPLMPTADELLPYLRRIDEEKTYSNNGPLVRELEEKLSNYHGAPCVTVSNGTLAIELALRAFGVRARHVAVPAATFIATVLAVQNARCTPVLCDVSPKSWQLNPVNVPDDVSAIIPVAIYGQPVDSSLWENAKVPVIIDAAGAFSAQIVTLAADAYCFSLHATKHVGAGEGGFVLAHDEDILRSIRKLASFGATNAKMSEYHAAVALASLANLRTKEHRIANVARWYAQGLGVDIKAFENMTTLFPMLVPQGHSARAVQSRLLERGIETRRWYQPFANNINAFDHLHREPLPVTEMLTKRMLGLPFHAWLTQPEVDRVCQTLAEVLK